MILSEALEYVFNDSARITRRQWNSRTIFISVIEGKLCITGYDASGANDPRPHPLTIIEDDWFADDWEVVE